MQSTAAQKLLLRLVGVAGAALFTAFFWFTYSTPAWVENVAAEYIEARVAEKIDARIDNLRPPAGDGALARYAQQLYQQNEVRIDELKEQLKSEARARMQVCLAQIRELSPELREKLIDWLQEGRLANIDSLLVENRKLTALIQSSYFAVVADLKRDIRVFTATNAAAFLLLVLVSFLRPDEVTQLFVPGVLLTVATLACAYAYVFEQNWLLTLIHGDYLGFAYTAYLGVVFLFLCDIALNRGRITAHVARALALGI
jgi:hypothetical protein